MNEVVTMTVYANGDVFCWIVNTLNKSFTHNYDENTLKEVGLKKSKAFPYEIQVPIQIIGQFIKKDITTIDLYKLQLLSERS